MLAIDLASVRAAVYPRVKQVMLMWLVPLAIGVGLLLLWLLLVVGLLFN